MKIVSAFLFEWEGKMGILAEIKQDNRTAEDYLLHYDEYKRTYENECLRLLHGTAKPDPNGGGRPNLPGDPTGQKAVKLSELLNLEKWLEVVELVESTLAPKKQVFLKVRRNAEKVRIGTRGKPAWVIYTQMHYPEEIAKIYNSQSEKYYLGERTIKQWWYNMIGLAIIIAMKRGIL